MNVQNFENFYQTTYDNTLKFIVVKCNNIEDIKDYLPSIDFSEFSKDKHAELLSMGKISHYITAFFNLEQINFYFFLEPKNLIKKIDQNI